MKAIKKIGIIAPSSVAPIVELEMTVQWIQERGFDCIIHPQVYKRDWAYAGADQDRASAILDYAFDKSIDALWCARGGFGATHLLPLLAKATKKKKPAKKMLLGFSDVTALHSFTARNWKWETVHAPMPALRMFTSLKPQEHSKFLKTLKRDQSIDSVPLKFLAGKLIKKTLSLPIYGGNLAVWCSLIGTPYAVKLNKPHILFFEDIHEAPARILRMFHHLAQSGAFKSTKAIVFGDFTECKDSAPLVLKTAGSIEALQPLRDTLDQDQSIEEVAKRLNILTKLPILIGFPAGHGTQHMTLSFGKSVTIQSDGTFLF